MRKYSVLCILALSLFLSLPATAVSDNNEGSLQLDASRMENANKSGETKDDLYIKYNIELFNNNGNAKAEQNSQTQSATNSAVQQELFMAQSSATSSGIDLNLLFTAETKSTKVEVAAEPFDTAYLMYGIIIVAILGLLIIITRATIKEIRTTKTK
ncbi:hypothetical protein HB943_14590 [Listeria weihenstephanensis]|uniref:Type VII secretion protein EssA n=1 Tax=Listeria weihenstephanensis TaxID=1006155 RepID=A0A841ZBD1_9LIST|nr:type VII secretion EssA family protein [Listeria weihenstephanensis]MBC1501826.1 hypothetical protein [Listeria weihenstephanensis]